MAADTFGRVPNKESKKPEITVPVVTDAQKALSFITSRRCRVKFCALSFASITIQRSSVVKRMN